MNPLTPPIVVGVDGRPATLRAVAWAAREADRRSLPVLLVAVVPGGVADPAAGSRRAHLDLSSARRAALATAAVVTSTEVTSGDPATELARRSRTARLLVLGSDGGGAVARAVVADAVCPVVVVPARWDTERHPGEVVVAVDPTSPEETHHGTVALAADVAGEWRRPLLVAVVLPGAHTAPDVGAARRAFEAATAEAGPGVTVHQVLGHGDPAEELRGLVGPSTGLFVLGAPSADPAAGGVGRAVVDGARCPVALVPAAATVPSTAHAPTVAVGRPT